LFLVIALIAGLVVFSFVASTSWFIFDVLFFVFLVLYILSLLLVGRTRKPI
jgi:uncharacterized membrane protein YtjA (UPF0391 family)